MKSKKILITAGAIQNYMGIGRVLYDHFLKMGLPVVTLNGQKYAHTENLDAWAKDKFNKQTSVDVPETPPDFPKK